MRHDIHIVNTDGKRLAARRLPEGLAGIGYFHDRVPLVPTTQGLVVISLRDETVAAAGCQAYATKPLASARYRDRHTGSGANSGAGDAKRLANLVSTDVVSGGAVSSETTPIDAHCQALARTTPEHRLRQETIRGGPSRF